MTQEILRWVTQDVFGSMSYGAIFALMAVESSAFPFPSEVVMVPAGMLVAQGKLDPFLALAAGTAGSLVGAWFNFYVLGRWLGLPFLRKYGKWVFFSEKDYAKSEALFLKNAHWYTFAGRLMPVVRQVISIPAGVFGMRALPFALLTSAGAGIWCAVLLALGYFFGERMVAVVAAFMTEFFAVLVLAGAGWAAWKFRAKIFRARK